MKGKNGKKGKGDEAPLQLKLLATPLFISLCLILLYIQLIFGKGV